MRLFYNEHTVNALRHLFKELDWAMWFYLNTEWHNRFLDFMLPFLRNQFFWMPLYLFLVLFMPLNYRRRGWLWIGGFLLSFALADYISASVIKPYVGRLRPCNTPELQRYIHLLVECGAGKSFPSSHASNHFAFATFIAATLGRAYPGIRKWVFLWASLVAYSQVYVGVHFPMDVLCGAGLGILIGKVTSRIYNRRVGVLEPLPLPRGLAGGSI